MLHKEEEKQSFYELKGEWDMHSACDSAMRLGDISGHIDRHIHEFNEDHGGYGIGHKNFEGRMSLEICHVKELYQIHVMGERKEGGDIQTGRK